MMYLVMWRTEEVSVYSQQSGAGQRTGRPGSYTRTARRWARVSAGQSRDARRVLTARGAGKGKMGRGREGRLNSRHFTSNTSCHAFVSNLT